MSGADALIGIAGEYMDSLTANHPAGAPFAADVRATENGVETPLSEGLWKSARGWLYRHTAVDAESGGVCAFGTIRETGQKDAMIALRLKVERGTITESEVLVTREGDFALFAPRFATTPREIYARIVPPEHRLSRADLADIPRRYFDAIAKGDPSLVPVHPDANRIENGVQTTNSPVLASPSVAEGLRRLVYMQTARGLRVPVVDPERGLVWAVAAIDMPLMQKTITGRGKPIEITPARHHLPRTLLLSELFKVESGRITSIEAVMRNMPFGADVGWPAA